MHPYRQANTPSSMLKGVFGSHKRCADQDFLPGAFAPDLNPSPPAFGGGAASPFVDSAAFSGSALPFDSD